MLLNLLIPFVLTVGSGSKGKRWLTPQVWCEALGSRVTIKS